VSDMARETLGIVCVILLISIAILTLIIAHRRDSRIAHEKLSKQIAELPPNPEGTERIIDLVKEQQELTRAHVSNTVGAIQHDTETTKTRVTDLADEMRGQLTAIKERIQWLIKTFDVLVDRLKGLTIQIADWIASKDKDLPK